MRKKMLFLALALTAAMASLTTPSAQAGPPLGGGPFHACPQCTTLSNGSQCCINCQCNDGGVTVCPANACAEI